MTNDQKMTKKMFSLQNKILLYGNPEIIKYFNRIFKKQEGLNNEDGGLSFLENIKKLIESLRSSIGLENPKGDELLNVFINDLEEARNKNIKK